MEMRSIASFLKIDSECFESMEYAVENPTIDVRLPMLYKMALRLNEKLEPTLNRLPKARAYLRKLHEIVNKTSKSNLKAEESIERLKEYYAPDNLALRKYLEKTWPELELAKWLSLEMSIGDRENLMGMNRL